MAAYDLIPLLAVLFGLSESYVETIYRRLNEAGVIPRSAGRARELLDSRHIALWTFALLADVPSRAAADAAVTYFNLRNSVGVKAGTTFARWLDSFGGAKEVLTAQSDDSAHMLDLQIALHASRSRLELDCGASPRIRIVADATDGLQAESIYGPQDRPWKDDNVRKTFSLPGNIIQRLGVALHKAA
ncbi:hypothetical protein [Bradyrhizobium sp. CCBAU 51627]|uniref:hypothetical protein n=1 Tax=Bradyrhizobium sp. CCBAU 51627 TaxID=1325088 RepID=UPI002305268F|nr:hypothetical protein [Bradyrhizobium sp. CCBAU 51627]